MKTEQVESFVDIVRSNVTMAVDQRWSKDYPCEAAVVAAYLQNTIDTCREMKTGIPNMVIYGAFCHELAQQWSKVTDTSVPDGFRI